MEGSQIQKSLGLLPPHPGSNLERFPMLPFLAGKLMQEMADGFSCFQPQLNFLYNLHRILTSVNSIAWFTFQQL